MADDTQYPRIVSNGGWPGPGPSTRTDQPVGIYPQAALLYQQGGPMPYQFPTQAWFNPLQEQGYGTMLQGGQAGVGMALQNQLLAQSLMGGFNPFLQQMGMSADPNYINSIGGSFDPFRNPALDDAVQKANEATARDFNQGVMPDLRARAMAAGQSGSSRHGIAEGIALQGLSDQIGQQTAGMYNAGFESGMNRYVQDRSNTLNSWLGANRNALTGWGQAPGMYSMVGGANAGASNALSGLGSTQAQIGGYYQGLSNAMLEQQKAIWDAMQRRPYDNLSWYTGILNGSPGSGMGTTTTEGGGGDWLTGALGGMQLGNGLLNMFGGNAPPAALEAFGGGPPRPSALNGGTTFW